MQHFAPQQYFYSVQPLKILSTESWQSATVSNRQHVSLLPETRTNDDIYDIPSPN